MGNTESSSDSANCTSNEWANRAQLSFTVQRPDLLRGIKMSLLFASCGYIFSTHNQENLFSKAQGVEWLDVFISHCWSTSRWKKFFALCMALNINVALAVGYGGAVLAFSLQVGGLLPQVTRIAADGNVLPYGPWCMLFGIIGAGAMLMWWQFILECMYGLFEIEPRTVFLDRACICQTDAALKTEGLRMCGAFVANSGQVVVISDTVYWERLWCMFEIAAFAHARERPEINKGFVFAPVDVTGFTLILALISVVFAIVTFTYFSLRGHSRAPLIEMEIARGLLFALLSPFWAESLVSYVYECKQRMRKISEFDFSKARCTVPSDRELIRATIDKWWGDTKKFENYIRNDVCSAFREQGGSDVFIPLRYVCLIALPTICQSLDNTASFRHIWMDGAEIIVLAKELLWLFCTTCQWGIFLRAMLFATNALTRWASGRRQRQKRLTVVLVAVVGVFFNSLLRSLMWLMGKRAATMTLLSFASVVTSVSPTPASLCKSLYRALVWFYFLGAGRERRGRRGRRDRSGIEMRGSPPRCGRERTRELPRGGYFF